jgi:hypothetical protein
LRNYKGVSKNQPGPRELALRAMREQRAAQSIVKAKPEREAEPMPRKVHKIPADSKKAIVASLLTRKKGCTSLDVKQATGWPSVSMLAMAKSCGLKLRKEKTDNGLRYYGTAA